MPKCVSCSSRNLTSSQSYLYKSDFFIENFPSLVIYKCNACGLLQVDHNLLSENILTEYYRNVYRSKAKIASLETFSSLHRARGVALASLAKEYSSEREPLAIFELGSGLGYNLHAFSEFFPGAQLFTDELDRNAWSAGRLASINDGPYDIVLMSHVLEHLINPKAFVERVCQNVRPSGLLIVEVPYESENFVHQFAPEGRFHEPHITFFSKNSLDAFFELGFSEHFRVEFSGSAGFAIDERDRMIRDSLEPPLKDIIYEKLSSYPKLQRGMRKLYRWATGKPPVNPQQEIDLTNNTPDGTKVFLRIVLRRI